MKQLLLFHIHIYGRCLRKNDKSSAPVLKELYSTKSLQQFSSKTTMYFMLSISGAKPGVSPLREELPEFMSKRIC